MISYIVRNFVGLVDFSAEGADIEKLITYCAKNGIEIISPQKKGYILLGKVFAKDYKKLRKPAKKAGLKIKILKKHGIYFISKKYRKKTGLFFGMIFILMSILLMNLFVWEINVSGNERVKTEKIIESAKEMGLVPGTFSSSHFAQEIEWYILKENEDLASVEINIQGSVANILVNETTEKPENKSDDDVPTNIVASRYGIIRKMDVFDGQESVKVGDAVMKGDLLVSAVYEDRHNKLTLKHARANIIAETDYTIEVEFPLEQTIEKIGKVKKKIIEIEVLGLNIKLGNNRGYEELPFEKEERKLSFFWIELPINVMVTRYFNVKENSITYNFEQGKDGAFQLLENKENTEMSDMEIISRSVTEKVKDNKYIIRADYICLMNIAEEQALESDIPWENTDDIS